jgi:6-phosphogluconolactonase (cycloisomerase 2 family)
MKFSKPSQLFLVSSIGLLVATLLTACSTTTTDYVYVATSAGIEAYAVDSQSGVLRSAADTVTSGVDSIVAMTVSSDDGSLYIANKGDNSIVRYSIGLHGGLTKVASVTAAGTPVALAVNAAGTYLYVVSGTTSATLTTYSLASGAIGSGTSRTLTVPGYASDTLVPTGVTVMGNDAAVYVAAWDQSAYNPGAPSGTVFSAANSGWVFGFAIGSNGTLTEVASTLGNGAFEAGVRPSALVTDPRFRFLYVTDYASNQLIGYSILNGNTLSFFKSTPSKTGNEPSAITVDPRGKFIYVTNLLDSTISAYAITQATGDLTSVTNTSGSQLNATDPQPVSVIVDPALARFVYTANYLGNSISGFRLDATAGSLTATQGTPYNTGSKPVSLVAIPHGNHASESVTP